MECRVGIWEEVVGRGKRKEGGAIRIYEKDKRELYIYTQQRRTCMMIMNTHIAYF